MKPPTLIAGELLYEGDIRFTQVVEYGVAIDAIASGRVRIPLEGARFDQVFEGDLRGPRLSGTIKGTDYLYIRADGRFQLHIHAQVITQDGVNISFVSDGTSIQEQDTRTAQLRSAVSFFTSSPGYAWLNQANVWAMGTIDIERAKATIEAYQI